jgi:hypothetical protein
MLGGAMRRGLAPALALLLALGGAASAAPVVYHSPADDGGDPGMPVELPPGPAVSLFLYVDPGDAASASGTACKNGAGEELCALAIRLGTAGDISIQGFVPDPQAGLVFGLAGGELRANGVRAAAGGWLGATRLGELVVSVSGGGSVELLEGQEVGADLALAEMDPAVIALPEPDATWLLAAGVSGLAALRAARGRRRALRRAAAPLLLAALLVLALEAPAQASDLDGDGVDDSIDNCVFAWNPGQEDGGAYGSEGPDGNGDACQCGDLDGNGRGDLVDVAIYARDLAGLLPEAADPETCSARGGRLDCDLHDLAALREQLAGLAPGAQQVCQAAVGAPPLPDEIAASGDSITRGFAADCTCNTNFFCLLCLLGMDQPEHSWFDGTVAAVASVHSRYPGGTGSNSEAVTGAEMVDGTADPNFEDQVDAILAQTPLPELVAVELGGNDICSRGCIEPANCSDPVYGDAEWTAALRAGLDRLVAELPLGATVYLLGVPRVQDLRAAGLVKQAAPNIDCEGVWADYDICTIATQAADLNGEDLLLRAMGVADRQIRYNEILRDEALAYSSNQGGVNPRGIEVVADYVNETTPSVGSTSFGASHINGGDCFHPSVTGQRLLSDVVWDGNPRR